MPAILAAITAYSALPAQRLYWRYLWCHSYRFICLVGKLIPLPLHVPIVLGSTGRYESRSNCRYGKAYCWQSYWAKLVKDRRGTPGMNRKPYFFVDGDLGSVFANRADLPAGSRSRWDFFDNLIREKSQEKIWGGKILPDG